MRDEVVGIFGAIVLATGLLLGVCLGTHLDDSAWRKDAVETGHAEYVLDGDKAVWRWKDVKQ